MTSVPKTVRAKTKVVSVLKGLSGYDFDCISERSVEVQVKCQTCKFHSVRSSEEPCFSCLQMSGYELWEFCGTVVEEDSKK